MLRKIKLSLLCTLFLLFSVHAISWAQGDSSRGVIDIDVVIAKTLVKNTDNLQILDVRTPEEIRKTGKMPNAIAIDLLSNTFKKKLKELDPKKPVLIYCKSGARSAKASEILMKRGFTKVYNLKGGYMAWLKNK